MAQDVFLKTESILTTPKQDVNPATKSTASSREDVDRKDFSSELNKQIDRHHQHDKREDNAPVTTKRKEVVEKPSTEKAAEASDKSGKKLPVKEKSVELNKDVAVNTDAAIEFVATGDEEHIGKEIKPEVTVIPTVEVVVTSTVEVEEAITPTVEIDVPLVAPFSSVIAENAKSLSKVAVKIGEQLKNNSQENKLPQNLLKTADTEEIKLESSKVFQKHQPASLRPDILNALVGKSEQKNAKFEGIIAKQQLLTPTAEQSNSKVLTDSQQLDALMKQVKPGQALPTQIRDAAPSSFVPLSVSASNVTSAAPTSPVLTMQPVVQSEAWNLVLSNRVTWMAREGVQRAVLQLNPANLGPVEVKLSIQNEQATVTFTAQHALTREALEQALPRLRDSMQENDLELVKAEVNQQSSEQEDKQETEQEDGVLLSQQADNMAGEDSDEMITIESGDAKIGLSLYA